MIEGNDTNTYQISVDAKKYKISRIIIDLYIRNGDYKIKWMHNNEHIGTTSFNNKKPNKIVLVSGNYSVDDIKPIDAYNIYGSNYNYIRGMNPDILIHAGSNIYTDNILYNDAIIINRLRNSMKFSETVRSTSSNIMLGNNHDKDNSRGYYDSVQYSLHIMNDENKSYWIKIHGNLVIIGIENIIDCNIHDIMSE